GARPSAGICWLPLILVGLVVAAVGLGALLSALTVAFRDFRCLLPFLIQFWFFATPSSYLPATTMLGARWKALLPVNPAYALIGNFRQALLGGALDWPALGICGAVSLLLLSGGCHYFRSVERGFADII